MFLVFYNVCCRLYGTSESSHLSFIVCECACSLDAHAHARRAYCGWLSHEATEVDFIIKSFLVQFDRKSFIFSHSFTHSLTSVSVATATDIYIYIEGTRYIYRWLTGSDSLSILTYSIDSSLVFRLYSNVDVIKTNERKISCSKNLKCV